MSEMLKQHLSKAGFSLTKPRQAVFNELEKRGPQTVLQLNRSLSGLIDRASIYRTVKLFTTLGIVQRVHQGWKYQLELTDKFSPHHHHLICNHCGLTVDFAEPKGFETMLQQLSKDYRFEAHTHSLEIRGVCNNCQKSRT